MIKLCIKCKEEPKIGKYSYCKGCQKIILTKWIADNREHYLATKREYSRNVPPEVRRKNKWLTRYGMTSLEWELLFKQQKGVCKICKQDGGNKILCVDHCHKTGKIRGLLCDRCNTTLGKMEENTEYLTSMINFINDNAE